MPKMYAYGTSATQIKKRYAMIGSTATQVKKRYAMIGSTATLVYGSELAVFNGTTLDSSTGGWVDRNGSLTASIDGGVLNKTFKSYINDRTANMIDVSDYNTLTVVFSNFSTGSSRTPFFGLWSSSPGNTVNEATNFVAYAAITKTTTQQTYVIDISSVTGSYYIGIAIGMGDSYDSSYGIESIILS